MELIAYRIDEVPEYVLEPADHSRAWMDATENRFAYRCLPLVMANQAGWVVRCPLDFEVYWNGQSEHGQGLKFSWHPEDEHLIHFVQDHFGDGILTFSLPYLFRTPPGYGMLVRGPTNSWVPGAHPLDGLVETDWIEATFTMNWKIVDQDRIVRFKKGDPICHLMPYPLALLEAFQPRVVPIEQVPPVKEGFEAWSQSRESFNAKPTRKPEEWQKDYFQGKKATGEKAPGHKTRLNLNPFLLGEQ